jgi:hypothetical protein
MAKKIAILVRDRQEEALRMALGLILMDDVIDLYVLDGKIESSEDNVMNIETMKEMDMNLYTNFRGNEDLRYLDTGQIAERLPEYDIIVPY